MTITVATFIERLSQMEAGAAPYGPEGTEARTLLAERGLSGEVIDHATGLLREVAAFNDEPATDQVGDAREAEDAMWQWYLEWSAIARQAITNRSVLRRLGFLQRSRRDAVDQEMEEVEVIEVESHTLPTESSAGLIASPQLAAENQQAEVPAEQEVAASA